MKTLPLLLGVAVLTGLASCTYDEAYYADGGYGYGGYGGYGGGGYGGAYEVVNYSPAYVASPSLIYSNSYFLQNDYFYVGNSRVLAPVYSYPGGIYYVYGDRRYSVRGNQAYRYQPYINSFDTLPRDRRRQILAEQSRQHSYDYNRLNRQGQFQQPYQPGAPATQLYTAPTVQSGGPVGRGRPAPSTFPGAVSYQPAQVQERQGPVGRGRRAPNPQAFAPQPPVVAAPQPAPQEAPAPATDVAAIYAEELRQRAAGQNPSGRSSSGPMR